jgi:hypothetical protein
MKVTHCLRPDLVEDEFAEPPQTIVARGKPKAKLRAPFLLLRFAACALRPALWASKENEDYWTGSAIKP